MVCFGFTSFSFFFFNISFHWTTREVPHSHLMHCNLTKSPDPEFQLLPLTGYVTLDKLFSLGEPIIWEK